MASGVPGGVESSRRQEGDRVEPCGGEPEHHEGRHPADDGRQRALQPRGDPLSGLGPPGSEHRHPHAQGELLEAERQPGAEHGVVAIADPVGHDDQVERDGHSPQRSDADELRPELALRSALPSGHEPCPEGEGDIEADLGAQAPRLLDGSADVLVEVERVQEEVVGHDALRLVEAGGLHDERDDRERHPVGRNDPQQPPTGVSGDVRPATLGQPGRHERSVQQVPRQHEEHRHADVRVGQIRAECGVAPHVATGDRHGAREHAESGHGTQAVQRRHAPVRLRPGPPHDCSRPARCWVAGPVHAAQSSGAVL